MDNYKELFVDGGLTQKDFMTTLRNNFYYVLIVVPCQTILALFLAMVVNQKFLKGRSFFRSAFYFPSVTSSVAISVVFLFIFQNTGAVNAMLAKFGITGPNWFADARGLIHIFLERIGVVDLANPPTALVDHTVMGLPVWEWIAGPSVAMCTIMILSIWTTSGTFMLMFLAALQDVSNEVDEAAMVDGAGRWQRFRYVTLPAIKPTLFLVITLGLIGTWQVFDQVYIMSQGGPAKTTLTPAYLSYTKGFSEFEYGVGAAIAFCLFLIIMVMTLIQKWVMRDKDAAKLKKSQKAQDRLTADAQKELIRQEVSE